MKKIKPGDRVRIVREYLERDRYADVADDHIGTVTAYHEDHRYYPWSVALDAPVPNREPILGPILVAEIEALPLAAGDRVVVKRHLPNEADPEGIVGKPGELISVGGDGTYYNRPYLVRLDDGCGLWTVNKVKRDRAANLAASKLISVHLPPVPPTTTLISVHLPPVPPTGHQHWRGCHIEDVK